MRTTAARFDFHGVSLELQADEAEAGREAARELADDFRHFAVRQPKTRPAASLIVIRLRARSARPELTRGAALFHTRMCRVRGWGRLRVCDYGQGRAVVLRSLRAGARRITVWAADADALRELAYSVALSAVGEALDLRGYHRIHAVGLAGPGRAGARLLALPSGGGKSSEAARSCLLGQARIFSDELPLLKDGRLHPFPVRVALRPEVARALGLPGREDASVREFRRIQYPTKLLYAIPPERVARAARPESIQVARGRWPRCMARARFVLEMTLGLGLPQMAEYLLRSDNALALGRVALWRAREAWRTTSYCPVGFIAD